MPDYYTYDYSRIVDGVLKINNPDRMIIIPNEHADTVASVTDTNAKTLFEVLFPSREEQKLLYQELLEHETFGSIVYDIKMSGDICSIRFTRELTTAEISELDLVVEAHKNNS